MHYYVLVLIPNNIYTHKIKCIDYIFQILDINCSKYENIKLSAIDKYQDMTWANVYTIARSCDNYKEFTENVINVRSSENKTSGLSGLGSIKFDKTIYNFINKPEQKVPNEKSYFNKLKDYIFGSQFTEIKHILLSHEINSPSIEYFLKNADIDRFAFSCEFIIDKDGHLYSNYKNDNIGNNPKYDRKEWTKIMQEILLDNKNTHLVLIDMHW